MKIISVVGARPNFMKIAPFCQAISIYNESHKEDVIENVLVHTGQHYDVCMSDAFFHELNIPDPDINLEVGSGSHAEQVGHTMIAFEKVLIQEKPDWVVVVGDVNATLSCSVTAKKLNIKVCHIEAGLRSGDTTMPEEINRLVTDRLADLLLTPDTISSENLRKEGVIERKIAFVGNIMIDTMDKNIEKAAILDIGDLIFRNLAKGCSLNDQVPVDNKYAIVTLHRPSNVDKQDIFEPLLNFLLSEVAPEYAIIWPIHPRTRKQIEKFGLLEQMIANKNLTLLEPVGYHDMLRLNLGSRIILTDSGGIQEECCVLGKPCITLRWNTERPVTLIENGGVSVLVGNNINMLRQQYYEILKMNIKPRRPELWDGNAAERCVKAIVNSHIQ